MLETFTNAFVNELLFIPFLIPYFILEYYRPAVKVQRHYLLENFKYLPIWVGANAVIATLLTGSLAVPMQEFFRSIYNVGFEIKNPILMSLVGLLTFDLAYYWFHRFSHNFLWFHHKFHHSDKNLNTSTAWRHHWLENVFIVPFVAVPIGMLSIHHDSGSASYFINGIARFITYAGLFSHANIRWEAGWFSYLFTNPQYHRIHQSVESQHRNKNFAAYFPFIDYIFGTFHKPKHGEWPATGLSHEDRSAYTLWDMFVFPFKYFHSDDGSVRPRWFRLPFSQTTR